MTNYVLDASALLALINKEEGSEEVEKHLHMSVMSTVNVSECTAVLTSVGFPYDECQEILNELIPVIVPFTAKQAHEAGRLRLLTKSLGLSLGDRACLALGNERRLPILTADKIWTKLKYDVKVISIRK
jgi:PIN domain nuclease of toxin-antitoxin system